MSRAPRHSPWVLALACAFASGAFVGSGYAETIHTLDGRTLKKAIVAGLSPAGATIKSSSGVDTIAYEHWPPKLRKRYGYDPVELSKYVHEGIDGAYAYWKVVVFEGEHLTLERGRFSYAKFSDVIEVGAKPKPPITGSYQMIGQWVIFDSPEVPTRLAFSLWSRVGWP